MEKLFDELIEAQFNKLYACALQLVPGLTKDDLMQPFDYPELDANPYFRHEEGVLEGLHTARMAFRAKE